MFRCPIDNTCLGGNSTTRCTAGYEGALCGGCATKYGRQSDKACGLCDTGTSVKQNRAIIFLIVVVVRFVAVNG